jgi:uncharacterized C2H2 Zn-finger protein
MQLFDNLNLLKEHFFQVHQSHKYDLYKCKLCINSGNNNNSVGTANSVFNSIDDLYTHLNNVHHHHVGNPSANSQRPNGTSTLAAPGSYSNNNTNGSNGFGNNHYSTNSALSSLQMLPPNNAPDRFHYLNHPSNSNSSNIANKCFKCNYCDSDFAQQNSLNQHIQMVHKINSPQQPPAVAVAPSSDYRYNQNGHHSLAQQPNTTNNLSCQYCRNTFTNRSQLERHLRIHLSSIDLKCNICDRLFETQDLLSQHKLTHCKIYDTMDTAVKPQSHHHHQNNHHNNNNQPIVTSNGSHPNNQMPSTAICVYCKQTIENESQFKEHFKRHNNIGIQNQAQHGANGGVTKTNSFICIVCRQTLTSNSEYNLHMKHHLRRLLSTNHQQHQQAKLHQQQQQQSGNIQNGTIDKNKLKPEVLSPSTTTNSTLSTNKLKCSKCLVKFEVWQELVEHMSKAHNIRTASSSSSPSSKSTTANSSLQNNEPDASRLQTI